MVSITVLLLYTVWTALWCLQQHYSFLLCGQLYGVCNSITVLCCVDSFMVLITVLR